MTLWKNTRLIALLGLLGLQAGQAWADKISVFYPRVWMADVTIGMVDSGWNDNQDYDIKGDSTLAGGTWKTYDTASGQSVYYTLYFGSADGTHNFGTGGDYSADRLDLEYLIQFPGKPFSTYLGMRAVHLTETVGGTVNEDHSTMVFVGEYGIGKAIALDSGNRNHIFGNLMGAAGVIFYNEDYNNENESYSGVELAAFYDFNVGYQLTLGNKLSLQLRYRIFANIPLYPDEITFSGPELSIGIAL